MIGLLVSVLVFALLVALLAVATTRIVGRAMGRRVDDSLRAAEHIARTHRAPLNWAGPGAAAGRSDDRRRAELVRRLELVITTVETAPVYEDERARAVLLGELGRARADWLTLPVESIVENTGGSAVGGPDEKGVDKIS
jgi:hypothetical protein